MNHFHAKPNNTKLGNSLSSAANQHIPSSLAVVDFDSEKMMPGIIKSVLFLDVDTLNICTSKSTMGEKYLATFKVLVLKQYRWKHVE